MPKFRLGHKQVTKSIILCMYSNYQLSDMHYSKYPILKKVGFVPLKSGSFGFRFQVCEPRHQYSDGSVCIFPVFGRFRSFKIWVGKSVFGSESSPCTKRKDTKTILNLAIVVNVLVLCFFVVE